MTDQFKLRLHVVDTESLSWKPKRDINAYELAQALPVLLLTDCNLRGQMFSDLPPDVARHFHYRMKVTK